jgi:uncharacterized membrane protein
MSVRTKLLGLFLSIILGTFSLIGQSSTTTSDVKLYTPYLKVSLPPGESVDYSIDLINNSGEIKNADISVSGLPSGWNYTLKSGAYNIRQISVLPNERKSFNLKVDVPLKVNKGSYHFQVIAGELDVLPLTIVVSEQGTFKTEFTTNQANMQGNSTSTFSFQTSINNRTADRQHYALSADVLPGWIVNFKPNYQLATSVDIEANSKTDVGVEIDPPDRTEAGTYKIPVRASTNATSAAIELEVVITGTYGMVLTTPTGLLSTDITAGERKRLDLVINNTGSTQLKNVNLSSSAPINWEVVFSPAKVDLIEPGKSAEVAVSVKASKKAIAGDYVTNLEATTSEATSKASLRITVKTPMIWGWVGIFVILGALGVVYYLFRKYGRR